MSRQFLGSTGWGGQVDEAAATLDFQRDKAIPVHSYMYLRLRHMYFVLHGTTSGDLHLASDDPPQKY